MNWQLLFSSTVLGPVALLYLFLLNDQWCVKLPGKGLLLCACAVLGGIISPEEGPIRILLFWLLLLIPTILCTRVRKSQFFFSFFSAMLFSTMSALLASMLAAAHHLPLPLVRICFDTIILLICWRFFRASFLQAFQSSDRGWGLLLTFPLLMDGFFTLLLTMPDLEGRMHNLSVELLVVVLSLFTIAVYLLLLQFFSLLHTWQERLISSDVLHSQYDLLSTQFERWSSHEEAARILRHDLRHYSTILHWLLKSGDTENAKAMSAALRQKIQSCLDTDVVEEPEMEVTSHDG